MTQTQTKVPLSSLQTETKELKRLLTGYANTLCYGVNARYYLDYLREIRMKIVTYDGNMPQFIDYSKSLPEKKRKKEEDEQKKKKEMHSTEKESHGRKRRAVEIEKVEEESSDANHRHEKKKKSKTSHRQFQPVSYENVERSGEEPSLRYECKLPEKEVTSKTRNAALGGYTRKERPVESATDVTKKVREKKKQEIKPLSSPIESLSESETEAYDKLFDSVLQETTVTHPDIVDNVSSDELREEDPFFHFVKGDTDLYTDFYYCKGCTFTTDNRAALSEHWNDIHSISATGLRELYPVKRRPYLKTRSSAIMKEDLGSFLDQPIVVDGNDEGNGRKIENDPIVAGNSISDDRSSEEEDDDFINFRVAYSRLYDNYDERPTVIPHREKKKSPRPQVKSVNNPGEDNGKEQGKGLTMCCPSCNFRPNGESKTPRDLLRPHCTKTCPVRKMTGEEFNQHFPPRTQVKKS